MQQVNELLDEARGEVLSTQLEPVRVDVAALVSQVTRQLQGAMAATHEVLAETSQGAEVLADREALWQVLWHLGENATKYSPDGGRVELGVWLADDGQVVMSVADEGIGVPEDVDMFAPSPVAPVTSRPTSRDPGSACTSSAPWSTPWAAQSRPSGGPNEGRSFD